MGNSLVGFNGNETKLKVNYYINWIIETIFQDKEWVDYFLISLSKKMKIIRNMNWNKNGKVLGKTPPGKMPPENCSPESRPPRKLPPEN